MTRFRAVLVGCAVVLTSSLLLARVHPWGNAGLYTANPAQGAILEHSSVPIGVRVILAAKCADCHSMRTRTPLYGRLAPVSWLLERDILSGRRAMNFDAWESYSADRQQALVAKIVQETKSHRMPLVPYRLIHWNARVTDADLAAFTQWAHGAQESGTSSIASGPGDAGRGREVFEKRCTGCHALEKDREGPRLNGVYGRTSGTGTGFAYSPALKRAHILWDDASLEQWLADPDVFVAGNNMEFHVPKPQERRDLIAFLKQQSGK